MQQIPKEILEKATEGGWHPTYLSLPHLHNVHCDYEIVCDPKFFQALGKALDLDNKPNGGSFRPASPWRVLAIRYFKIVIYGGDTEKFWKELLNERN